MIRLAIIALALLAASAGHAAAGPAEDFGRVLDGIDRQLAAITATWEPALIEIASDLLLTLLGIGLFIRFATLLFQGQDFSAYVFELIKVAAIGGFYTAAIQWAPEAAEVVIDSFTGAAQMAIGFLPDIRPGAIFVSAIDTVMNMVDKATLAETVPVMLIGAVTAVFSVLMSAYFLLVLAETYIVTVGGIVLLAFGGLNWTEDFAKRYMIYVVSVGAKLFALYLTLGFSLLLFQSAQTDTTNIFETVLALACAAVLGALLTISIPGMVQGIVNGSSIGMGTGAIMTMGTMAGNVAAKAAMGAVKTTMGARAATGAAVAGMGATSVREAVAKAGGGAGGAVKVGGTVTRNATKAMMNAFGHKASPAGSVLGELRGMRAAAEAMRDSPPPPPGGGKPD